MKQTKWRYPFLELDMMNIKDSVVTEIKNFSNLQEKNKAYKKHKTSDI